MNQAKKQPCLEKWGSILPVEGTHVVDRCVREDHVLWQYHGYSVQHHPEYVSLAWEPFKLMFVLRFDFLNGYVMLYQNNYCKWNTCHLPQISPEHSPLLKRSSFSLRKLSMCSGKESVRWFPYRLSKKLEGESKMMEELYTGRIDGGGSPYIGQVTWWGEDALQQKSQRQPNQVLSKGGRGTRMRHRTPVCWCDPTRISTLDHHIRVSLQLATTCSHHGNHHPVRLTT
jgi:hypothetical protein